MANDEITLLIEIGDDLQPCKVYINEWVNTPTKYNKVITKVVKLEICVMYTNISDTLIADSLYVLLCKHK